MGKQQTIAEYLAMSIILLIPIRQLYIKLNWPQALGQDRVKKPNQFTKNRLSVTNGR
jgi:hypothetical protein